MSSSVLQSLTESCSVLQNLTVSSSVLQCLTVSCSVLQCLAVSSIVLEVYLVFLFTSYHVVHLVSKHGYWKSGKQIIFRLYNWQCSYQSLITKYYGMFFVLYAIPYHRTPHLRRMSTICWKSEGRRPTSPRKVSNVITCNKNGQKKLGNVFQIWCSLITVLSWKLVEIQVKKLQSYDRSMFKWWYWERHGNNFEKLRRAKKKERPRHQTTTAL